MKVKHIKRFVCRFCKEEFNLKYNIKLHLTNNHMDKMIEDHSSDLRTEE